MLGLQYHAILHLSKQVILNLIIKYGGERILSTITPVDDDMYKAIAFDRLEVISGLHEASGGVAMSLS